MLFLKKKSIKILFIKRFKRFYLFLFREGKGGRKRERNINVWLPLTRPLLGNLAHNPGVCPNWELKQ